MFYSNYERRINQIVSFRNLLFRFRLLILGVLSVAAALGITYMGTKGTVTEISCPNITYGENVDASADAMFSDIQYEYCLKGTGEWTTEVPSEPGEYVVRTVTKGTFGNKYKEFEFVIEAKQLTFDITDNSVVYGTTIFNYNVSGLLAGHSVSSITFDYANNDTGYGDKTITANKLSIIIVDAEGEDVTHCYEINVNSKIVTIAKRVTSFKPYVEDKVYDGESYTLGDKFVMFEGDLSDKNDKATIGTTYYDSTNEVVANPINAGEYTAKINNIKIENNGVDVTSNYNLNTNELSSFVITKRSITVETNSYSREYNGTQLTGSSDVDYWLHETSEYQLVDGHKLVLDENESIATITNVGTINNEFKVRVVDQNDNDVTDNYDIDYVYGTLEVTPRAIVVGINPATMEYNGAPYVYTYGTGNYTLSTDSQDIVAGEELEVVVSYKDIEGNILDNPTNVGEYEIYSTNWKMNVGSNDNYSITVLSNTLTITKRVIEVDLLQDKFTKEYDNTSLLYPAGVNNYVLVNTDKGMPEGQGLELLVEYSINEETVDAPVNAGKYLVTAYDYNIENGSKSNYEIKYNKPAEIVITPRVINVSLNNAEKVYDGQAFEYINYITDNLRNYQIDGNGMIEDQYLIINIDYTLNGETSIPINANINGEKYLMTVANYDFHNALASNYTINFVGNTAELEITPIELTITINTPEGWMYGEVDELYQYSSESHITIDGEVVDGEFIAIPGKVYKAGTSEVVEIVEAAGKYEIKADGNWIITGSNNVSTNYDVTIVDSDVFEVIPRTITVNINDGTKTYDGKLFEYSSGSSNYTLDENSLSLVGNDELEIFVKYQQNKVDVEPINAGTYAIVKDTSVYENGWKMNVGLDSNYEVTINSGELVIEQRAITIAINSPKGWEYSGIEYLYSDLENNYKLLEGTLVENEILTIHTVMYKLSGNDSKEVVTPIVDAGTYKIELVEDETLRYTITGGQESYANYEITCEESEEFEITPRKIEVNIIDQKVTYSNEIYNEYPSGSDNYKLAEGSKDLVGEDKLEIYVKYQQNEEEINPINAGEYEIVYNEENWSQGWKLNSGNPSNYNVTINPGKLVIEQIKLTITINSPEGWEYCGEEKTYEYVDTHFTCEGTLAKDETITIPAKVFIKDTDTVIDTVIDANEYEIKADGNWIITGGQNNADNYDVTIINSGFIVTPRIINVSILDKEHKYNGQPYEYENYHEDNLRNYNIDGKAMVKDQYLNIYIDYTLNGKEATPLNANVNGEKYVMTVSGYDFENAKASNYKINFIDDTAELTINPVDLELSIDTPYYIDSNGNTILGWVFDGREYSYNPNFNNFTETIVDGKASVIVGGEEIKLNVVIYQMNKDGSYMLDNEGYKIIKDKVYDSGYYQIELTENKPYIVRKIADQTEVLATNYNISFADYVTFEVQKREVIINITDQFKEYDGKATVVNSNEQAWSYPYDASDANKLFGKDSLEMKVEYLERIYSKTGKFVDSKGRYDNGDPIEPINAGYYTIRKVSEQFITELGLSDNYTLSVAEMGTLTVMPREIEVTLVGSSGWEYGSIDTPYQYDNKYIITNGELLTGHTLSITYANIYKFVDGKTDYEMNGKDIRCYDSVIDAGRYEIAGIDDGWDITGTAKSNYAVRFVNHKFTVTPKVIYVDVLQDEYKKDYDGIQFAYPSEDNYTLADKNIGLEGTDKISIKVKYYYLNEKEEKVYLTTNPINAGTYYIEGYDFDMIEGVKSNYDIKYDMVGKVVINKRIITATINDATSIYDGNSFKYQNYDDDGYLHNYEVARGSYDTIDGHNLIINTKYYSETTENSPNVGTYTLEADSFEIYNSYTNRLIKNAIDNYDVKIANTAILTVDKRVVDIVIKPNPKPYDGEPFVLENFDENGKYIKNYEVAEGSLDLVNGDQFIINATYTYKGQTCDAPVNYGQYKMNITARVLASNGDQIDNSNYEITWNEDAILYITPRVITVEIDNDDKSYNKVYDNIDYQLVPENEFSNYKITSENELINGHRVMITKVYYINTNTKEVTENPINAAKYNMKPYEFVVYDSDGNIVTDNYIIDSNGKAVLEIYKREINIIVNTPENKTYDGIEYYYDGTKANDFEYSSNNEYSLLDGHKLYISSSIYNLILKPNGNYSRDKLHTSVVNAGLYELYATKENVTIEGTLASNYEIIIDDSIVRPFEIYKKDIEFDILSDSFEYNNRYYNYPNGYDTENYVKNYNLLSGGLVSEKEQLIIAVKYKFNGNYVEHPFDAGTYSIELDLDNCIVENGDLNNYNLISHNGTLVISKYVINYTFDEQYYDYNGYVHKHNYSMYHQDRNTLNMGQIYPNVKYYLVDDFDEIIKEVNEPIEAGKYLIYADDNDCSIGGQNKNNYDVRFISNYLYINKIVAEIEFEDLDDTKININDTDYNVMTVEYTSREIPFLFNIRSGSIDFNSIQFEGYYYKVYKDSEGNYVIDDITTTSPINAGLYLAVITDYSVGDITSENYNIDILGYEEGNEFIGKYILEILPRKAEIKFLYTGLNNMYNYSLNKTYDGMPITIKENISNSNLTGGCLTFDNLPYANTSYSINDIIILTGHFEYIDKEGNIVATNSIVNAGTYSLVVDGVKINGIPYDEYIEHYNNYELEWNVTGQTITINKRFAKVQVNIEDSVYNGKDYRYSKYMEIKDVSNNSSYSILSGGDEELIKGITDGLADISIKSNGIEQTPNLPGIYDVHISDFETQNYIVTCVDSSFTISKRNIVIGVEDKEEEYDASAVELNDDVIYFESDYKFLSSDKVTYNYTIADLNGNNYDSIINAGMYTIRLYEVMINDNYKYVPVNGKYVGYALIDGEWIEQENQYYILSGNDLVATINVTKAQIQVETFDYVSYYNNGNKIYSNTEYDKEHILINGGWRFYNPNASAKKMYDIPKSLVSGHTVLVDDSQAQPYAVNVNMGGINNSLIFRVVDSNGVDVTNNYNIVYSKLGKIKVYDQFEIKIDTEYRYNSEVLLSNNEILNAKLYTYDGILIPYVDVKLNDYNIYYGDEEVDNVVKVGNYKIEITDYTIYHNKTDISSLISLVNDQKDVDYDRIIDFVYTDLEVKGRLIIVKPVDKVKTYDGTPLTVEYDEYQLLTGSSDLLHGHQLYIETLSITNYGTDKYNYITNWYILDSEGNIVDKYDSEINCYEVICQDFENMDDYYSTLKIERRVFDIETPDYVVKYEEGVAQSYDGDIYVEYEDDSNTGILDNHKFVIDYFKSRESVGSVSNRVYYLIYDENGNDVTDNYKANASYGTLYIVGDIEITLDDITAGDNILNTNVINPIKNTSYSNFEFNITSYKLYDEADNEVSLEDVVSGNKYYVEVIEYSFMYNGNEISLTDLEPENTIKNSSIIIELNVN